MSGEGRGGMAMDMDLEGAIEDWKVGCRAALTRLTAEQVAREAAELEVDLLKAELATIEEAIRDYYDSVNAGGDQYAAAAFALGRIQTAVGMPPGRPATPGDGEAT